MDKILPAYYDPLFSIFIIVVMILLVAIVSNVMGNFKEGKQRKSLKSFLGKLSSDECSLNINKIPFEPALINPLSLLANTLTLQGEYQKSINIYLYLIENISSFQDKEHLLEGLGKTYLKAGFLKRSESVFLEILHKHARNKEVLFYLEVVYELLHDYDKATQTLKPLQMMGMKSEKLEAHLQLVSLLKNEALSKEKKVETLENYLHNESYSYRRIMQELFRLDIEVAWHSIDEKKILTILDILWFLPTSNLNFDIIASSKMLSSIYFAKGVLPQNKHVSKSGIFTVDTIVAARNGHSLEVDLSFSYGCSRCKQQFPITFIRCPNCYAIDSIQIKESIAKKQSQTGYSLL
ncbi:MAG: hypothetical protein K0U38_08675 [Epsilonproteobacteria bacterium]|nr:hypothetical protein [Campylobacterota bacterium]